MALIKCPDCEKMISPRATVCPFCGCPSEYFSQAESDSANNDVIIAPEEKSVVSELNVSNSESLFKEEDENSSEELSAFSEQHATSVDSSDNEALEVGVPSDITFGSKDEQNPNTNKYPFAVIVDPERETDNHPAGRTHVLFRIGVSKYLKVSKDDLFYAPIEKEIEEERNVEGNKFREYLSGTSSLSGITSGAKDRANSIMSEYCQFLVEKLVKFGIYEYDFDSFVSRCGSQILIEDTDSYESILRQKRNVDSYAQNLSRQRDIERASRSQWQGGGFGLTGAIKGAVTAGAMNAATGAFRSIGDGMTDAGDRSEIQSQYSAIVNDKNRNALYDDFSRGCLFRAKNNFYRILAEKSGWNAAEVLEENWKEANAKLNNLEHIDDKNTREKILIELLSQHPFHYDVLNYAMSNYMEYDFNLGDLLHYVKRMSSDAFDIWMKNNFADTLHQIEISKIGQERKQAIVEMGITFGVIDENLKIVDDRDIKFGANIIMSLIEADMSDFGYSLNDLTEQTDELDVAEQFFEKLLEVGHKHCVFEGDEVNNALTMLEPFSSNPDFALLLKRANEKLNKICTVRGILCENINKAKILTSEWNEFDEMYSPYDSYADYDSTVMQDVIEKMKNRSFSSEHIQGLIFGDDGLESKRIKLEAREKSEIFKKSQQIVKQMIMYAGDNLFVYGSNGFLEAAKSVRELDKIKETEKDIFPLVIYNVPDSDNFKGFVVTDNYFYNYNSMWGIGFGDKALNLYDIRETAKNGKNRLFKLSNGKTEKIKIIDYEDLIIGTLSEIFIWISDLSRMPVNQPNLQLEMKDEAVAMGTVSAAGSLKPCPNCGRQIPKDVKFCTFCGNKIESDNTEEEKVPCPNCGQPIPKDAKFCTFCGNKTESNDTEEEKVSCSNCGKMIKAGAKFCTFCGATNTSV